MLLCKSDNAWERCNWIHRPPGEKKGDKYCKMEWKQATVTLPSSSILTGVHAAASAQLHGVTIPRSHHRPGDHQLTMTAQVLLVVISPMDSLVVYQKTTNQQPLFVHGPHIP